MSYQVNVEQLEDKIIMFECYGEEFPIHPLEWKEFHSFWQEDYFRLVLQPDMGLLTIYYGKYDMEILWRAGSHPFQSIHDIYHHLNTHSDPFMGFIYGDWRFEEAFDRNRKRQVTNYFLEKFREDFNVAYDYYYSPKSK